MKKPVIKRRKRVPAAGSASRLSDQAAAEALVSVGRGFHAGTGDEEEDDEDSPEPERKRSRRSFPHAKRGGKDKGRDGDDEEGGESEAQQNWEMADVPRPGSRSAFIHPPHPFTVPGGFELVPCGVSLKVCKFLCSVYPPVMLTLVQWGTRIFVFMSQVGQKSTFERWLNL
jgi:GATA-binding protein, other eukaryote